MQDLDRTSLMFYYFYKCTYVIHFCRLCSILSRSEILPTPMERCNLFVFVSISLFWLVIHNLIKLNKPQQFSSHATSSIIHAEDRVDQSTIPLATILQHLIHVYLYLIASRILANFISVDN